MIPKFSFKKSDRVYITKKYLTNGHFLITQDAMRSPVASRMFKDVINLRLGSYTDGIKKPKTSEDTPDLNAIIPQRDGYEIVTPRSVGVEFRGEMDEIFAYRFEGVGFEIGFDPIYVPILRLGVMFAKNTTSPCLVLSDGKLNSELIAVVMPIRLEKK